MSYFICQHIKSKSCVAGQELDHAYAGHVGVTPVVQDCQPHLSHLLPVVNFKYLPFLNIKRKGDIGHLNVPEIWHLTLFESFTSWNYYLWWSQTEIIFGDEIEGTCCTAIFWIVTGLLSLKMSVPEVPEKGQQSPECGLWMITSGDGFRDQILKPKSFSPELE